MKNFIDEINIKTATREDDFQIKSFFNQYLSDENKAIYNGEFLCPDGLKFAIMKGNVIVAKIGNIVVGALRYYKRKRDNCVSLYQFAISEAHRSIGLVLEMLSLLKDNEIIVKCPIDINFNEYYLKTGWILKDSKSELNTYSKIIK